MKINKIALALSFILISIVAVIAYSGNENPLAINTIKNIIIGPLVNASNNGQLLTSASCNISIYRANGTVLVNNSAMTSTNNGFYNYSYTFSSAGDYPWYSVCVAGTDSGIDGGIFRINETTSTTSAREIWQYRVNSTQCDTNISFNESPTACAELNDLFTYRSFS